MDKEKLLRYEMWSICEYVSWDWLQNIIAKLMAYKVNRKIHRYNKRIEREDFLRKILSTKTLTGQ